VLRRLPRANAIFGFKRLKIHLSWALAGQAIGIKEQEDGIWLVSFLDYDLGYFDAESELFECLEYPFAPAII
jgi:putative transposase